MSFRDHKTKNCPSRDLCPVGRETPIPRGPHPNHFGASSPNFELALTPLVQNTDYRSKNSSIYSRLRLSATKTKSVFCALHGLHEI